MNIVGAVAAIAMAVAGLVASAQTARAQEHDVVFRIRSTDRYAVEVRFFSESEHRRGWRWPGGDRSYSLKDSEVHDIKLRCYHHEYICYGVWVEGNWRRYWGAGPEGKQHCDNCCWHCDNDYTQVINLHD